MDKSKKIEKTEEFIAEYEFEVCLWDVRNPEYKNRDLKQAAIQRLAVKFQISESDVKSKIINLRAYYSRELAKEKSSKKSGAGSSGAGSSEVFKSKWPHFQSLMFLRDVITPRKTQDNLPDNFESTMDESATQVEGADENEITIEQEREVEERDEEIVASRSTKRPLEKKPKRGSDSKEEILQKTLAILEKTGEQTTRSEDEHDAFGRHIACQLRKMTERERELAHFKIQEVIFNIKFSNVQQPAPFPAHVPSEAVSPHNTLPNNLYTPVTSQRTMSADMTSSGNIPHSFVRYLQSKDM